MQLSFPIRFIANVTLCNKLGKRLLYGFDHIKSHFCSENYKNNSLNLKLLNDLFLNFKIQASRLSFKP